MHSYLPEFATSQPSVARGLRSPAVESLRGLDGRDYADLGRGDDALARYVTAILRLPQQTPVGKVFAYNNAAIELAGA